MIRISTPYISDSEKRSIDRKENKKKWINTKDFNNIVGIASSKSYKVIPNYVCKTPSQFPLLNQFRSIDKKKWVINKNFYVS